MSADEAHPASSAEEWSDADFDLPEGSSLVAHLEEHTSSVHGRGSTGSTSRASHLPPLPSKPGRPTTLRMSTGPDDIDEDDDLAAFLAEEDDDNFDTIKMSRGSLAATTPSSVSGDTTPVVTGTVTRLNGVRGTPQKSAASSFDDADEDWDADLGLEAGTTRLTLPKHPLVTIAPPIGADASVIFPDDDIDISTIKVSRHALSSALTAGTAPAEGPANTPLPPSPNHSPPHLPPSTMAPRDDDDSMEDAFELPDSLSRLSLRPLSTRSSKATLSTLSEWASDTTGTTVVSATSDLFDTMDGRFGKHNLSASPSTDFTTDEEDGFDDEDREAKDVEEDLVLPDTFLPKDLVRILDSKKKGLSSPSSSPDVSTVTIAAKPKSKHAEEDDDFETGLQIGNDSELSPSRLLKKENGSGGLLSALKSRLRPKSALTPKEATPSLRSVSSRATLTRAQTLAAPSAGPSRNSIRIVRSPSPQPRRSEESTTSLSSKASAITLRRTKPSSSTITPKPSIAQNARNKQLSPPPLAHSYSMLTLPRIPGSSGAPTSPSKSMKHQKSTSRLLMTPKAAGSAVSKKDATSDMRLGRKASLSSLQDAERAREQIERERNMGSISSNSGSVASTSTSASNSQAGSTGKASQLPRPSSTTSNTSSAPRYNAPTASSRAKAAHAQGPDRPTLSTLFLPVLRPTTPIESPGASRLTMPTLSSRAKSRVPIAGVFSSESPTTASPPSRQSAKSPPPPRVSSPSRIRQPMAGPSLMKKPKSARTWGDGTELDGLEDLAVENEKERKYRVTPKATSNMLRSNSTSTAVVSKSGTTTTRRPTVSTTTSASSTATLGRKTPVSVNLTPSTSAGSSAGGSIRRPPSRTSATSEGTRPGSAASLNTPSTGGGLLRRKSRMDIGNTSAHSTTTSATPTLHTIRSAVPLISPAPTAIAVASMRRKRASPSMGSARKPTLIRNLSGPGVMKKIGDMQWNPITLRWEGNESALRGFESPTHSRPALITQLTGSSVGGMGSPSGLISGARIVGNMMFDPTKMCWINRFADEEPDPFAGIDDDSDDDRDATLGKRRGNAFRARSNTGNFGAPTSGTPLETVTASPARSAVSRRSVQSRSTTSESDTESALPSLSSARSSITNEDEFDDFEDGTSNGSSPERLRRAASIRGASSSPIPGVDETMVEACREAELRHKNEVKGWFPRRRTVSSVSRSTLRRRIGLVEEDVDDSELYDRSYLFEIRTLATRQY
ncbi:hypothetical protein DL93DRAFT_2165608 [Clavulina sp. PMI_390]|nr:hypothetical protein DL93DRAFT_2165608 [Clavulina sp. PMI_390]